MKKIKSPIFQFVILSIFFTMSSNVSSEEINSEIAPEPEIVEAVMENPSEKSSLPSTETTTPEGTAPNLQNTSSGMEIPQIAAKTYDLKIIRPSQSLQMYLFSKESEEMPDVGRIILLKSGMTPVMGFRVIKVYVTKKQIAAKKIKSYPGFESLSKDSTYRAFEKLGELSSIPSNSAADITDLNELEGGTSVEAPAVPTENFPSLDQPVEDTSLETPNQNLNTGSENLSDSSEPFTEGNSEEDEKSLSGFYKNIFGFDFGSYHGKNMPGGSSANGLGISYSKLLSDKPKGALAAEIGLGYYKSSGDVTDEEENTTVSESFTVMPITMRLRYHFNFSEEWSYYLYGGFIYNRIASQFGATEAEVNLAQGIVPGLGAGVYIPTGPGWYLRLNLGIDFLGFGVALRF